MDVNSFPWTYEVVGHAADGVKVKFKTNDVDSACAAYTDFKARPDLGTVLFCKSRLGVVKGEPGK